MAGLICKNRTLWAQTSPLITLAARHGSGSSVPLPLTKVDIGKREVVGYGGNGEATYIDSVMHPFPAIRSVPTFFILPVFLSLQYVYQVQGGFGRYR